MRWLREHGAISCYADYEALPLRVIEDAQLMMVAEAEYRARRAREAEVRHDHRR